jgi:nitrate reductase beta subunit
MCNCKAPYNKMYVAYQTAASQKCNAFQSGTPGGAYNKGD